MCRDMVAPQSIETIIGIDNDITGKLFDEFLLSKRNNSHLDLTNVLGAAADNTVSICIS